MFLGIITLIIALSISAVSAYYSIVGLTSIFAAAFWSVVIMGVALEAGKIVSTVWLHYHWKEASIAVRWYLVIAVGVLMFITSMGTFGFLSRAHSEQGLVSGDVIAQIQIFDEKIKTQRDNIDLARKTFAQMNLSVDQLMSRTTDEKGAEKATNLRRSQTKERARLQQEIDVAQKAIAKLQEERAPIAAQVRKVEAEVGPIRYIAALIYGDTVDQNLLEAAVRFIIIVIVSVFDPLAIVLILAATYSIDWARSDKEKRKKEADQKKVSDLHNEITSLEQKKAEFVQEDARIPKEVQMPVIEKEEPDYDLLEESIKQTLHELDREKEIKNLLVSQLVQTSDELAESVQDHQEMVQLNKELLFQFENMQSQQLKMLQDRNLLADEVETLAAQVNELQNRSPKEVEVPVYIEVEKPVPVKEAPTSGFGTEFPINPTPGDMFLRIDFFPSKLYKWNSDRWIEVDKALTDSYTYNEQYIRMLISKISNGEFDIDDLSQTEQEQIQEYLNRPNDQLQ